MASIVIVVPKDDECRAVRSAFDIAADDDGEYLNNSHIKVWRSRVAGVSLTIARLDAQTNTYSGVRTLEIIHRENPRQIFLIGTALGKHNNIPVGSVLIAERIGDVSERRPTIDNPDGWVIQGPFTPNLELVDAARNFVFNKYRNEPARRKFYSNLEHEDLDGDGYSAAKRKVLNNLPHIAVEPILSGNEYIMGPTPTRDIERLANRIRKSIWEAHPSYKAYDMEAAGFMLAARASRVPWLVFRAISDHGTEKTKLDRTFVSFAVAKMLREFLEVDPDRIKRISSSAPRLPGELATRLVGKYSGHMGYVDDNGQTTVYREFLTVRAEGEVLRAEVQSQLLEGEGVSPSLAYSAEIRLGTGNFFSGIWAPGADTGYAGSLSGSLEDGVASGIWTGGHGEGIRIGTFLWYSDIRMEDSAKQLETFGQYLKSVREGGALR